jgi:hypothetical protein
MTPLLAFGEHLDGYAVPVLNERAVRAGAGILFLLAMVAFMNAWLLGNFGPTRMFVVGFLIDFTIRIFVNPRYAPSLVLGQWVVRKQQPEWTGAPQKTLCLGDRFRSGCTDVVAGRDPAGGGAINILVCATCITLLFFETAFGICIGCKVYNLLHKDAAQLCPGGVCAVGPDPRVQPGWAHGLVLVAFAGVLWVLAPPLIRVASTPGHRSRGSSPKRPHQLRRHHWLHPHQPPRPVPLQRPRPSAARCLASPRPWAMKRCGSCITIAHRHRRGLARPLKNTWTGIRDGLLQFK